MTREDYLKGLIIKRFGSIRKFAELYRKSQKSVF